MNDDLVITGFSQSHSIMDSVNDYIARGWSPIPVPYRSKKPVLDEWQRLRITRENARDYFKDNPTNLGGLLGEPSGGLADVDLDHPVCVELAPKFLPPTPTIFGRAGKPRSHWVFRTKGPIVTKQFKTKSTGMLVELRSTGAQTIFPPSVHESGEAIEWVESGSEPALVDPAELSDAVKRLADAVKIDLGLKAAPKEKKTRTSKTRAATATEETGPVVEGSRNSTLTSKAGKLRRLGMDESDINAAIQYINEKTCNPPLDPEEVRRIAASIASYPAGGESEDCVIDDDGCVSLGSQDPETGRLVLSPKRTVPTAAAYVRQFHHQANCTTLVSYGGQLLHWQQGSFRPMEDAFVQKNLQRWLHASLRYIFSKQTGSTKLVDFESNPGTVKAALESVRTFVHLPASESVPFWRTDGSDLPPPHEILACKSLLLHLPSLRKMPATPQFFTFNALDFDFDPVADQPEVWLAFLAQIFGDDQESISLLQEWFGLCLVSDTSHQKMLLIVGPKRSGKGTLARILSRLVGIANVCGPTTSSLAGTFGLQPLLFKTLAVVSDARFHGDQIATVVERLLCISGEDTVTVDRKFMESITLKLQTRFMFLSNELPRLTDASGALASRFLMLRLTESFYGREDLTLANRLFAELPGILNWAISGWQRLRERGHFVQPASVAESVQDMEDLSSPVKAFVRDCCRVQQGLRIDIPEIFDLWLGWCKRVGRDHPGTSQIFGRDLQAAFANVKARKGTNNVRFYEGISRK